ncbi:MAG: hypothetical protein LBM41_04575 [Ruminococcus sp.]|jgi:hypothetical protein|nr:hypothetical protein [Ruminococcus sp.]
MKALGLAFLAITSAAIGAAVASYVIKKQNDLDLYDFEFDEDDDFADDDFADDDYDIIPTEINVVSQTDDISDLEAMDGSDIE